MTTVTALDGAQLFYKDWGPKDAQPIMFHHGWPVSSDEWDNQMRFFLSHGFRVIAHDRRGHGRSDQISGGHEIDIYASDVAAIVDALDLREVIHVGHSVGGGEVVRYAGQAKRGRLVKAVLIGAVPPLMAKTAKNPDGIGIEIFDSFRAALSTNRAQFFLDMAEGPFYGFDRSGARVSQGLIQNWWRQGMAGSAKAQYECIKAFSETDFTEDLTALKVPVLILHGDDDQVVSARISAYKTINLVSDGTLKTYLGLPHGLYATHPKVVNADLLQFVLR